MGEAKTLGCLPGILRQVQGPPTTRRRLATGDPGDTSQRAAKPVDESTAVSNPQHWHWANRTSLALPPELEASPAVESRCTESTADLRVFLSMRTLVANANRFKVSAALDLRALKPSHDAKKRAKPSRCGSLWSYRRCLPVHYSFAARVDQSASATSFPCTSGDVSRLARRDPRATRLSSTA